MNHFSGVLALLTCICLVGGGCDSGDGGPRQVQGRLIEIDYSSADTIRSGAWIEIDEYRFTHVQDLEDKASVEYPLPTTYVVVDSLGERGFGDEVDSRVVALRLAQNFGKINEKRSRVEGKPVYDSGPSALYRLQGKIRLSKADSSTIQVRTTSDYPAQIQALER